MIVPAFWRPSGQRGVVVGVDGTELSGEALHFAFRTASNRHVPLTVVHTAAHPDGEGAAVARAERILAEGLAGWTARFPTVEVRRVAGSGPASATLLAEARTAELLVAGARISSLAIVNPVVRQLVAQSPCPIAVLPHTVTADERARARRYRTEPAGVVRATY